MEREVKKTRTDRPKTGDTGRKVTAIIVFKETVTPDDLKYLKEIGGTIKFRYDTLHGIAVELPRDAYEKILGDYRDADKKDKNAFTCRIRSLEEDKIFYNVLSSPGPGPQGTQPVPWNIERVRAPAAWAYSRGTGVKVAVFDTGIDDTHPDLDVKGGVSFVDYTASYRDDASDGHGTCCAGIIAARDNDTGVVGVAPEALLYAVKVTGVRGMGEDDYTFPSWIMAGIEWAITNQMQVVSMSFGIPDDYEGLRTACQKAYDRGIVLVAAAGNGNVEISEYPALYDTVIAVTATDVNNNLAAVAGGWGSNFGPKAELAAPGLQCETTIPESSSGKKYGTFGGTSCAAPHVAGVTALLMAMWPSWTARQIRMRMAEAAMDLGNAGRDIYFGYGLVDAYASVQPVSKYFKMPKPIPGDFHVPPLPEVMLKLVERIDRESVTQSSIVLRDSGGNAIRGTISADDGCISFLPAARLAAGMRYTATVSGIRTMKGKMIDEYAWSFTTARRHQPG